MGYVIEERSKITAKGQTTLPKAVRQALGVDVGDEVIFNVNEDGVVIRRANAEEADPVIERFLHFLADDVARNPTAIVGFPENLARRMAELTDDIDIDLQEDIDGAVAI
ncbi:MAG: type II toxin-antitoxin system PrlF family antitoxin [Beijerinckiaceae bacterium]|nr:type II toxin-antitoxin system PrlF family antitoxin [Beijerinckiaceae bacterium]